jgi:hypothetical protein
MYDHASREHQGSILMGFRKGEIMELVKTRDDGWSKVVRDTESGWAPTSYLKPVEVEASEAAATPDSSASPVLERRASVPRAPAVEKSIDQLEEAFLKAHAALFAKGKEVVARDRELALLSNALVGLRSRHTLLYSCFSIL